MSELSFGSLIEEDRKWSFPESRTGVVGMLVQARQSGTEGAARRDLDLGAVVMGFIKPSASITGESVSDGTEGGAEEGAEGAEISCV